MIDSTAPAETRVIDMFVPGPAHRSIAPVSMRKRALDATAAKPNRLGSEQVPVRLYEPHVAPTGALTRPSGEPWATIVWAHGGSFMRGNLDWPESDWVARQFASHGIRVIAVDYILASETVKAPAPANDVAAVLRWVESRYGGPILVGGASAGGNLAAEAAIIQAAVAEAGIAGPASGVIMMYPTVHRVQEPNEAIAQLVDGLPDIRRFSSERIADMYRFYLAEDATPPAVEDYMFIGGPRARQRVTTAENASVGSNSAGASSTGENSAVAQSAGMPSAGMSSAEVSSAGDSSTSKIGSDGAPANTAVVGESDLGLASSNPSGEGATGSHQGSGSHQAAVSHQSPVSHQGSGSQLGADSRQDDAPVSDSIPLSETAGLARDVLSDERAAENADAHAPVATKTGSFPRTAAAGEASASLAEITALIEQIRAAQQRQVTEMPYAEVEEHSEFPTTPVVVGELGRRQLSILPATIIVNAEADELRASGEQFARQLRDADVQVFEHVVGGTIHGFLNRPEESPKSVVHAKAAVRTAVNDLRTMFDPHS